MSQQTVDKVSSSTCLSEAKEVKVSLEDLNALLALKANQSERLMEEDEIDLAELWQALMKRKWLIVMGTFFVTIATLIIAFSMTPKYEAKVVMLPVSSEGGGSSLLSKYGGLASMAGISLPTSSSVSLTDEALAVLQTRQFLAHFIKQNHLKKVLFYKNWDEATHQWIEHKSALGEIKKTIKTSLLGEPKAPVAYPGREVLAKGEPSMADTVKLLSGIISVSQDKKTNTISLTVKWSDPLVARDLANKLVRTVDNQLREKAIISSENTIKFVQKKLEHIRLNDIKIMALNMIEENVKKITFAKLNKEYVFKVIDPAVVPDKPVSPKKGLMVVVGFVLGMMLSIFIALILNWKSTKKVD